MNWLPIESAPKDGTRILGYGQGYKDLDSFCHDANQPKVPVIDLIYWVEAWIDDFLEQADGSYIKARKLCYAYWGPHSHAFGPTHWMPLPEPPK